MQTILIIGLGHFGTALVNELSKSNVDLIVIEEDQERADSVKDMAEHVVVANAANKDILEKFAQNIDCAIVCLSQRIDSSVLITYQLKEIGVPKIIAKARTKDHGEILKSIGADEVIYPEEETARRVARSLGSTDILDAIRLSDDFEIIEIPVPQNFIKNNIKELQLRNRYEIDILAVKNPLTGAIRIMPPPDYEFQPDDVIIFIGPIASVSKLKNR
ncbi:MAG: TrkA family potassium uptake protein [Candidatus Omnitrophota bacterium]